MRILVLNAGSSTLKASVLDHPRSDPIARETLAWGADASRESGHERELGDLLERLAVGGIPLGSIEAVGHRVVHGGGRFVEPVVVDDAVLAGLDELADLAPLHNPVAIAGLRAATAALPDVPHVACFDTAFHATLPPVGFRYAVPDRWFEEWGVRRFGFHGLSVEWAVRRAASLLERPADELRLVVAHLGSGCSVTAVDRGRSAATSMGMTPLEGLVMGTRAGSIDPGVILALLRDGRLGREELDETLDHGSGMLAVGGTADMRALIDAETGGDERAALAIEMFVRSAAAGIAAATTVLDRLDALVFTGGIGEGAVDVRARIVGRLGPLGIASLQQAPATDPADVLLSAPKARPAVLRIEAREDVVIARAVASLSEAAYGELRRRS